MHSGFTLYDHQYFVVCIIRTSLPFYALNDVLTAAIERQIGLAEKVLEIKVLASCNKSGRLSGQEAAKHLWEEIEDGGRLQHENETRGSS